MYKWSISFNINASLLKIVGVLIVLVGLFTFTWGCVVTKMFVVESAGLVVTGAGLLGYRKHILSKGKNGDI